MWRDDWKPGGGGLAESCARPPLVLCNVIVCVVLHDAWPRTRIATSVVEMMPLPELSASNVGLIDQVVPENCDDETLLVDDTNCQLVGSVQNASAVPMMSTDCCGAVWARAGVATPGRASALRKGTTAFM